MSNQHRGNAEEWGQIGERLRFFPFPCQKGSITLTIDCREYGWEQFASPELREGSREDIPARVTAVYRERYAIVSPHGEGFARLKRINFPDKPGQSFPTVGDFVEYWHNPWGDSLITRLLPRKSAFCRRDPSPGRAEQMVAANFETVFVLTSLNHDLNFPRLERYLTAGWQSGGVPVILLTKADLVEEKAGRSLLEQVRRFAVGVEVYAVSALTGQGMEQLAPFLEPGRTAVLLGSSGVGKSSLVNALLGREEMAVQEVREADSRGRHTTTHRQMLQLPGGALLIDTPGMRVLGMWDVSEGLDQTFADVEAYLGRCRFADCSHRQEPGCAVREAVERGELSRERWENYLRLKREARYSQRKQQRQQHKQEREAERNGSRYSKKQRHRADGDALDDRWS